MTIRWTLHCLEERGGLCRSVDVEMGVDIEVPVVVREGAEGTLKIVHEIVPMDL